MSVSRMPPRMLPIDLKLVRPVVEGIASFKVFVFDLIGNREAVVLGTLSIEIHVYSAAFCERTEAEPS